MDDRRTEPAPTNSGDSHGKWLQGGGEMGGRIRAFDWSRTSLGPVSEWPNSLRTSVRIMLTSRQPIWIGWGSDLIYLYNDPYKSIIGGKHPRMLGQPTSVVWREIWKDIEPMLATAMRGEEGTYVESQLLIMERHGYREETYYTFSYSPIPDDEGRPGGIICANTDDTQRVISERQLALLREVGAGTADARSWREAAERSARALCTNPLDLPFAMIYLSDQDSGGYVLAGSCGIEAGHEAAPQTAGPDDGPWHLGRAAALREPVLVENLKRLIKGRLDPGAWDLPPFSAALVPISASGQTGRGGVLVVGLNPYRLLDDSYRNFLMLTANQISASIASSQAYEEEKKRAEALAEIDRAKTVFFSNVSHEFRTPLTLMLGPLADALGDAALPVPWREQLDVVHRNGLRLLKLVNSLLDFARIEAGRAEACFQPVDIATLTQDLASSFRSAIERAGLEYRIEVESFDEPTYVDRDMWEKIVLNLLSNAFKFTLEGTIRLRLAADEGRFVLEVSDTGVGIPATELPRLFERFHRVEGARGRTHEGTGIGLALVHELVKLHGGAITVESSESAGTAFRVSIPFGFAHLPRDRVSVGNARQAAGSGADAFVQEALRWLPEESPGDSSGQPTLGAPPIEYGSFPDAHGARVLVADDNADMREYLLRLLSPRFEVVVASDGAEALDLAEQRPPDVVLSDVMMPNLDGFGLLERLRANPSTASVPVILLSARAGEEATVEGLQAGADDYLIKPFSSRELLGRVSAQVERRRFEQALRRADERLRSALTAARMAAWEWYPESGELNVSDTIRDVFGLSPDTVPTKSGPEGFAPVHPSDAERYRRDLRRVVEGGEGTSYQCRFRIVRPVDRAIAWMEERGAAHRETSSGRVRVTGVVMDVTEHVLAEEAVRESERRFLAFADTAPALLWITEPDGSCSFLSRGWYEYTGQTEKEGLGFGWLEAVHPDDRGLAGETYMNANTRRVPFELEYRLRRADGQYRWVIDAGRPRFGPADEFLGYIGSVIEIHERKRAEEQNTALLESERSARAEAERVNLLKDEFLATLSHELRSPLNAIVGWSQILSQKNVDPKDAKRGIETIQRNARAQAQMIEDLLDMSRIISGKVRLDVQRVDLADVIEQAVHSVLPSAEARSIRLLKVLDPHAGPVSGDPNRLQQVIWNLLSNAIKFTPKDGKIQVVLERVNSHLEISIADSGEGIEPEFLPHLFDRFRQADASTTRQHGGLGLGLSIVKQLTELHGGAVKAKSPGKGLGATFVVSLPLAPAVHDYEDQLGRRHPRAESYEIHKFVPPKLDGTRVLIVDDDADARMLIKRMFLDSSATVLTASSAREALVLLQRERPDVLLSDIGMPGEDGYALISKVRELSEEDGGRTPAVALTAFARSEDRRKALLCGYQMHVAKPVDAAELMAVVVSLTRGTGPDTGADTG